MSEIDLKSSGKIAAAAAAINYVKDGMKIGLGTGSTASHFIMRLAEQVRRGLRVEAVATSRGSHDLAKELKIPLIDINSCTELDLGVDGADEIDGKLRLIKGGGGALFREKVVAKMSRKFIVIADDSKKVDFLGRFPLAVEILPFGWKACIDNLQRLGLSGTMRMRSDGELYLSDNGNHILDLSLSYPCIHPEELELKIRAVTGVIETGFFFNIASAIIIGYSTGKVEVTDIE